MRLPLRLLHTVFIPLTGPALHSLNWQSRCRAPTTKFRLCPWFRQHQKTRSNM